MQLALVNSSNTDQTSSSWGNKHIPAGGVQAGWRLRRCAHLSSQFLHVRVDLIQQVVTLLEQRVLGVHE